MDRGHRAQAAVAHVQRRLAGRNGAQGLGRIAAVGNDPHGVAQIKGARLLRDVCGGEMMVEEGAGPIGAAFGHDLTRLVVLEAIDHHPVETGQATEGVRRPLAHRLDRHRPFQRGAGGVQVGDQIDAEAGLLRALLDLDDHQIVDRARSRSRRTMHHDVVFQTIGRAPTTGEAGLLMRGHGAHGPVGDIAQHVGDCAIDPDLAARQLLDRARPLADGQGLQIQHQHEAVRLDRLRNVDRLAIALVQRGVGQVERLGHAAASCGWGCKVRWAKAKPSMPPFTT